MLQHEVAHAYTLGWFFDTAHAPDFLEEGLAVAAEESHDWTRLKNALAGDGLDRRLADAIALGDIWSGRETEDVRVLYSAGGSLVEFILQRWGRGELRRWVRQVVRLGPDPRGHRRDHEETIRHDLARLRRRLAGLRGAAMNAEEGSEVRNGSAAPPGATREDGAPESAAVEAAAADGTAPASAGPADLAPASSRERRRGRGAARPAVRALRHRLSLGHRAQHARPDASSSRKCVAVDGLDIAVRRGDVYGFLGPNGAGKTTVIRMILGLIRPTTATSRSWATGCRGSASARCATSAASSTTRSSTPP